MLVYIDNTKDDEEFNTPREYAHVYEYDDNYNDFEYEEKSNSESNDYEISYEKCEEEYLVH